MPKPGKLRPEGWSKEFVLWWLRENPTLPLAELCQEVVIEGVAWRTLYQEVVQWRRFDAQFLKDYSEAMGERVGNTAKGQRGLAVNRPNWQEDFARVYLETRDKERAAREAAGCSWASLLQRTKKSDPERYDQTFVDLLATLRETMLARYEAKVEWALDEAEMQGDVRTVANTALSVLERLDKKNWSRSEERQVAGSVEHHHLHEHRLALDQQRALAQAVQTSARLFGPRELPATTTPDAVDVEILSEPATVAR